MKKITFTFAIAMMALAASAVKPIKIDLTPADAQADEKALLEVYLPEGRPTGAVVVCPGGGYGFKAIDKEGRDWAEWFAQRGVATAVLDYRLPQGRHDVPLSDCDKAITALRKNAAKWKIPADKVGVMGFSAGGHLAATMATHYTDESRPDFQILVYPVVSMDTTITHRGSHDNLLGAQPRPGMEDLYSNELQVTPQTPPAFIITCEDDRTVDPDNSMRYYRALTKAGVPSELHVFPQGGHGYGKLPSFRYVDQMLYLLDKWIVNTVSK